MLKAVELFAGISGFGLGFKRAGIEPVCQVEIDENCRKLLADKFPETAKLADVRSVAAAYKKLRHAKYWIDLFELLRTADVWCGGFPCQDLSVAGSRAGLAGERSGLWFSFRRLVALFRPAWVVIENVPGLLSSGGGADLAVVVSGLEKLGYGVAWASLDSQYFGLAQRRERVFIVASLGTMCCAQVLFEPNSVCWDPAPSREAGQRTTPPIAGCSNGGGANGPGRTADDAEALIESTAKPLGGHHPRTDLDNETYVMAHGQGNAEVVNDGDPSLTCNHEAPILAKTLSAGRDGYNDGSDQTYVCEQNTQCSTPEKLSLRSKTQNYAVCAFSSKDHGADAGEISPTLRACGHDESHANGGGPPAVAFTQNQREELRELDVAGSQSTIRRGDGKNETLIATPPAVAFTERTRKDGRNFETQEEISYALTNPGSGGRTDSRNVSVNSSVRRLTPTECERLQGFPEGWTSGFSDSVRYRMLGNAVSVPVAEWIGRQLVNAHFSSESAT